MSKEQRANRGAAMVSEAKERAGSWPALAAEVDIPASSLFRYAESARRPGVDQAILLRDRLGIPLDAWAEPADLVAVEAGG